MSIIWSILCIAGVLIGLAAVVVLVILAATGAANYMSRPDEDQTENQPDTANQKGQIE